MTIEIHKITATEAVVESLTDRIRNCEFIPGEKLPSEQGLLKEYGVSRLTLREALAKLTAWGVIHVQQGKGAFVSDSVSISALDNVFIPMFPMQNPDRMKDLVEARNIIEAEIAVKVAEKRTREDIRILKAFLRWDSGAISTPEAFAERDYAFHLTLSGMAGNEFLHTMYQALHRQIRVFLIRYANSISDWKEALERHKPILDAIIDRDRERVRHLAGEHAKICASYVNNPSAEDRGACGEARKPG
ncbi:MAG: FadR family transcriptional regulator [Desulfamplus sp.]|nr:FadR family transcriptional regulator [Desulfamplus sp.]